MGDPATSIKVYLVHGTWAKGARWTREGSPLRKALEDGLKGNVTFVSVPWSGRNSAFQRAKAAAELPAILAESANDSEVRFIIAHSHGGNIALDWLGAQAFEEEQESDDRQREAKQLRMNGVITLNTPFLTILPRDQLTILIQFVALSIALNYLLPSFIVDTKFAAMIVGLVILLCIIGLALYVMKKAADNPVFSYHGESRTKVLAICTPDDEALGLLDALNGVLNLPALLLHKVALPVVLVGIAAAHYFFQWPFHVPDWMIANLLSGDVDLHASFFDPAPAIPAETVREFSNWFYENASADVMAMMMTLSVLGLFFTFWGFLALGSLLITYVMRALAFGDGFGPVSLAKAMMVRLNVSMTPLWHSDTKLVLLESNPWAWLRHSNIHENPIVLKQMVEWMNNRLKSK